MDSVSNNLLKRVLLICRCKSNKSLQEWKLLEIDITNYLIGKQVIVREVIDAKQRTTYKKILPSEWIKLGFKLTKMEELLKTYRSREMQIQRVLKSSFKNKEQ